MQLQDDREGTQQSRLSVLVGGKDAGMSGQGGAEGGISYAFWACAPEHADHVEGWIKSRGDMQDVRQCDTPPSGMPKDHCHIYCAESDHPSVRRVRYNEGEHFHGARHLVNLAYLYRRDGSQQTKPSLSP